MIDISIGLDGVPSINKITLGNQYENLDETIHFDLPQKFDGHYKYLLSVLKQQDKEPLVSILPVVDNEVKVSSSLSYHSGAWSMYLMSREFELDLTQETVDISAVENEYVFISDVITGIVKKVAIDQSMVSSIPLDSNYKIYYEGFDSRLKALEQGFDLSQYALKSEIPTDYAETNHTHDEYLTEIPSEYVTSDELENRLEGFEPTSTVQVDWNQNQETALDYIKNRPFYEINSSQIILDKLSQSDYESGNCPNIDLIPDRTYTVIINEGVYENIPCVKNAKYGYIYLQSSGIYIEKEDEGLYIKIAISEPYVISIILEDIEIKKLDKKFIPDEAFTEADWNDIKNRPFYHIVTDTKEELVQLDEKFIPSTIQRAKDENLLTNSKKVVDAINELKSGIQSDWNQNNENAYDYIKNRTHYVDMAYTSLLEGIARSYGEGDGLSMYKFYSQSFDTELVKEGAIMRFSVDTNSAMDNFTPFFEGPLSYYSTVDTDGSVYDYYVFGNKSFISSIKTSTFKVDFGTNENTGEAAVVIIEMHKVNGALDSRSPAVYICFDSTRVGGYISYFRVDTKQSETVIQLDDKFISDNIQRVTDENLTTTSKTIVGAINELNNHSSESVDTASHEDVTRLLSEIDMINTAMASDGSIFTNKDGEVFVL